MHRIVFLDRDSLRARLRPLPFSHEWIDYAGTREDEVLARRRAPPWP